jgi:hypothetical protein
MAFILTIIPLALGFLIVLMALIRKLKPQALGSIENEAKKNSRDKEVDSNGEGNRHRPRHDELVRSGHGGR